MSITRKLAKLILTLLTLPLLVVVWLLKWFVMFLYCCSAWIFYLLGSVLFATAVLSFLMKQSQGMEALQMPVSYTHLENSGKSEKVDVIANQIEICKSYIAERPYLNLIDTYVDNGRTGTVFDRPEFNRLMNDIRTGRIKCLVVRDLSRFGRDYIEAGTYLERVFPQIGLRFIAIKENYDNFDTDGSGAVSYTHLHHRQ